MTLVEWELLYLCILATLGIISGLSLKTYQLIKEGKFK